MNLRLNKYLYRGDWTGKFYSSRFLKTRFLVPGFYYTIQNVLVELRWLIIKFCGYSGVRVCCSCTPKNCQQQAGVSSESYIPIKSYNYKIQLFQTSPIKSYILRKFLYFKLFSWEIHEIFENLNKNVLLVVKKPQFQETLMSQRMCLLHLKMQKMFFKIICAQSRSSY